MAQDLAEPIFALSAAEPPKAIAAIFVDLRLASTHEQIHEHWMLPALREHAPVHDEHLLVGPVVPRLDRSGPELRFLRAYRRADPLVLISHSAHRLIPIVY